VDSNFLRPDLDGDTISLFPLQQSHFDEIFQAASDREILGRIH
jgi:hypothetical protein